MKRNLTSRHRQTGGASDIYKHSVSSPIMPSHAITIFSSKFANSDWDWDADTFPAYPPDIMIEKY